MPEENAVFEEQFEPLLIEKELKESYLNYAMSVIHSRALPDVRDGLKPSQRRILVAMNDLNLGPRSRYTKCANICGTTMSKYHPHGDTVIYPTLVRMGQDFNSRYLLIDKQGNFGSNRPDNPAAMRYTEARMMLATMHMLEDMNKETVDKVDNYDGTLKQPSVLPGRFPNLICNGSNGIAVGMATSLPPHNLGEVATAIKALIKNPDLTHEEIHKLIPGPDFPGGGIIMGIAGAATAYRYGRGQVVLRAKYIVEEKKRRKYIVITEIPYQVTRLAIIETIVNAVKIGRIDTISDVNDESNSRVGTRITIELKKAVDDETVTVNQLFKYTPLQSTFSIMNLAIATGRPRTLSLKELLEAYRDHRVDVLQRRTRYLLRKANDRLHIIEGLRTALAHIDEVVELIKGSATVEIARGVLKTRFILTEIQARSILDMRLARLTSLEVEKLEEEYQSILKEIEEYKALLADVKLIHKIILEQLDEMVKAYGDERRTEISSEEISSNIDIEALIEEELMAVTSSHTGYIKRVALDTYRSQGRGGRGVTAGDIKDGDFLTKLFIASTHDYILFFTNKGRCYWRKVYQLPELSRTARGRSINNILTMQEEDERITEILRVDKFDDRFLLVATKKGYVKKTDLTAYSRPKKGGIRAMVLDEGDSLIGVTLLEKGQSVILATKNGLAIRFDESDARSMGRVARGVRGIRLKPGDEVVSLLVSHADQDVLTVCQNGYGKRTMLEEYRIQSRGGQGLINIRVSGRNGPVVTALSVCSDDEVMMITEGGMIVRSPVAGISQIGRATQGVRVISLKTDDRLVAVAWVPPEELSRNDGNGESDA